MNKFPFSRVLVTLVLVLAQLNSFAQDSTVTLDNVMRSHDKIYVVMAVCLLILIVMILYLLRIDIKVSRKEKESKELANHKFS